MHFHNVHHRCSFLVYSDDIVHKISIVHGHQHGNNGLPGLLIKFGFVDCAGMAEKLLPKTLWQSSS